MSERVQVMHSARHHRVCLVVVMLTVIVSCPHAPMMHIDASHDGQLVLLYFSGFLFWRVLCGIVIGLIERGILQRASPVWTLVVDLFNLNVDDIDYAV